jgi:hypothetical protein
MPSTLPVLVADPAIITAQTISNLVVLTDFKDREKACTALLPACQGRKVTFREPEGRKSLVISPQIGYIDYFNELAEALPGAPVQGVPSEAETLQRAVSILAKLGINQSDTSHDPETHQPEMSMILGEIGQFDKQERKVRKTTTRRGMILFRQFQGISFSGPGDCGGIRVDFANDAKIKELAVSWRNLKVYRSGSVIGTSQIIQRIRDGKAVLRLPPESPNPSLMKKLTIQKFRPYYLASDGSDPQTYIYPYAAFRSVADFGFTNIVVTINCPILK